MARTDSSGIGIFYLQKMQFTTRRIVLHLSGRNPEKRTFLSCIGCASCCNPSHHFLNIDIDFLENKFKRNTTVIASGCWRWDGCMHLNGYGQAWDGDRRVLAHRFSYELFVGKIPDGLELDHTCHDPDLCEGGDNCPHRRCVNPEHLKPGTHKDNMNPKRSRGARNSVTHMTHASRIGAAMRRAATHCQRGHEWNPENTGNNNGKRFCIKCYKMKSSEYYQAKKTANWI